MLLEAPKIMKMIACKFRSALKNKRMKYISIIMMSFCLFSFASCINEEGEGGTSSVEGYIYKIIHPDGEYSFKTDTFAAGRSDVYIQYGDQRPYGDKMDAGPDGYFKFQYLVEGKYVVFAYNKYPDGHEEAVYDTVYVATGKTASTKNIYIHEGKMFGKSYVKGKILANYYDKNTVVASSVPAVDQRVYIRKKGVSMPFDDVRAGADGTFVFEKLATGNYEVYGVSEDQDRILYVDPSSIIEVKVTAEGTTVELSNNIIVRLRS